jgi:SPP1 gp7 family putative phage head morphogenesis protein
MMYRDAGAFAKTIAESLSPSVVTSDIRLSARQRRREAQHFARVQNAQAVYQAQLRRIARQVGELINAYPIGDPAALAALQSLLDQYATVLRPWAYAAAQRMIAEVLRRDETAWFRHAEMIGVELKREILGATPLGETMRRLVEDQVHLITSIPIDAGRDVQRKSREYWSGGIRYDELRSYVLERSSVTYNRATLIARTETAKTASAVVEARSKFIGATHYIWRSVRDRDVRRLHKLLDGTTHAWDDPPVAEEQGQRHHPGQFPNCRCYAEPILPDVIE